MTMTTNDTIGLAIVLAVLIGIVLMQVYSNSHRREVETRQTKQQQNDRFREIYATMRMIPESGETDIVTYPGFTNRKEGSE